MSYHVEGRHAASLALRKQGTETVRFEDSVDVSAAHKAAVDKKLPKGQKGK